ncbi:MAG: HU family DNA-binding protein [Magnetococcus sp. YQC-3]
MKKADLIVKLAKVNDLPQKTVAKLIEDMLEFMQDSLAYGDDVSFPGFGVLITYDRKEFVGRNPRTGDTILVPARKIVRFLAGQKLKKRIANEQFCIDKSL